MSLVNDMLRDLEQRRREEGGAEATPVAAAPAAPRESRISPWLIALALAVAAAVAWLLLNPSQQASDNRFQPRAAAVQASETAAKAPAGDHAAAPVAAEPAAPESDTGTADDLSEPEQEPIPLPVRPLPAETAGTAPVEKAPVEKAPVEKVSEEKDAPEAARAPQPRVETPPAPSAPSAAPSPARTTVQDAPQPAQNAPATAAVDTVYREQAPATPGGVRKTPRLSVAQQDARQAEQARALLARGDARQAGARLRAYLAEASVAPHSRALLASLLIRDQQWQAADELLDTGLQRTPDQPELKKLKARLLLQQGQAVVAYGLLGDAAPAVAADPEYHQLRAAALQAAEEHGQARAVYLQLLQLDAARAPWWLGLGLSLEALGAPEQARQAYRNVLRIPTTDPALSRHARQRLGLLGG